MDEVWSVIDFAGAAEGVGAIMALAVGIAMAFKAAEMAKEALSVVAGGEDEGPEDDDHAEDDVGEDDYIPMRGYEDSGAGPAAFSEEWEHERAARGMYGD